MTLRIPGEWEDVWLYRDAVVTWDIHGNMYRTNVDRIREQIRKQLGHHVATLAEFLILRSGRKAQGELRDMLDIGPVRRAYFDPIYDGDVTIELEAAALFEEVAIPAIPGNITDTAIYGNRSFVASDEGLFESRFATPGEPSGPLLTAIDSATTGVTTTYGQVLASLGDKGLRTREIKFGDSADWWRTAKKQSFEKRAAYSRATSTSSSNVLNYGVDEAPEFIRTAIIDMEGESGYNKRVIENFESPQPIRPELRRIFDTGNDDGPPGIEVLGNAGHRLLVRQRDVLHTVNLQAFRRKPFEAKPGRSFQIETETGSLIRYAMGTHALASGFVVEHRSGVHLFTAAGAVALSRGLAVQVRTYPNSLRYRDTVAIVDDSAINLIGFCSPVSGSMWRK